MVMLPETLGPEHFVRTLVTYLVAAALTLHMLLGCCWHHAHESASVCCTRESHNGASCDAHDEIAELEADHDHHDGDCPHDGDDLARAEDATHQDSDHEDGHHNKPGSQHESCGEKCSFVSASRVNVELDASVVALGAFASVAEVAPANEFVVRRLEAWGASDAPPPIRLHLLHQLLLI